MDAPDPSRGALRIEADGDATRAVLTGRLGLADLPALEPRLAPLTGPLVLDLAGVERIDTAVAWLLLATRARILEAGGQAEIEGAPAGVARLIATVEAGLPEPEPAPKQPHGPLRALAGLGAATAGAGEAFASFCSLLGLFVVRLAQSLVHPRRLRLRAVVHHCEDVGIRAVPIVALMSFLIGVVLAFQGAAQLRQFGAEVFVVDLIAISILRELGVLLTAIIVAGRTASAFTAAIGAMKMRQEIDAMHTLGIDPGHALVVPRILALLLMLPILTLISNVAGITGGALMAWLELGISPQLFAARLSEAAGADQVLVGLSKAPVFAVLIGVIGCDAGLRTGNNVDSLGRMTSASVVASIFAVILADALFSVFFEQIGV